MVRIHYDSPLGELILAGEAQTLMGAWFRGQKYFPAEVLAQPVGQTPALQAAIHWLDAYFAGKDPGTPPPLAPVGSPFRQAVWALLEKIPYGQVTTYGQLARQLATQLGRPAMSAQAVGGAVGHNPLALFIPCHRVVGADGSLTGYAGGLERKEFLLRLEGVDLTGLSLPVTQE